MRILLVEDDHLLGKSVCSGLEEVYKYTVDWVTDGVMALNTLKNESFDLVILDLGLPRKPGLDVLTELRQNKNKIPVLILTARDSVNDHVKGLDLGGDCYMTKPFDLDKLVANIRALLRRSNSNRAAPTLTIGKVSIDPAAHQVKVNDVAVIFSRREFTIIQKLMECAGRVVTRDVLNQTMYGWGDDVDSNTIEVHIHNIRKKLGDNLAIRTIRGVGYIIEEA